MSDELKRKSNHVHCLNALVEMQESNYYAVRRDVLKEAECLIWNYEKEVAALRAQLAACQEQVTALEQERGNWKSISETTFAALRKAEEELKAQRERADKLEQVANGVMALEYWGTHPKTLEALKKLKEQAQQALKE